jgi:hypothetical protein
VTSPAIEAEPACPGTRIEPASRPLGAVGRPSIRFERSSVAAIDPATWDALAARNPWATPFSKHAFHTAWWFAYGANAHDQTLLAYAVPAADTGQAPHSRAASDRALPVGGTWDPTDPALHLRAREPGGGPPHPDRSDTRELVAIVPLMHRHEVEAEDAALHTRLRADTRHELTPVSPQAKAVFLGATYHGDYATILAAPADLPAIAEALVDRLGGPPSRDDPHPEPWDVIDLRRLRCGDPAADALATAFGSREMRDAWTLNVEREDVCPVVTLPTATVLGRAPTLDDVLATLGKRERHEIRRKLRRAQAAGPVRLEVSTDPLCDLEAFIELHQRRWGELGLFPPTPGGDQSRAFFRCLFERQAYAPEPSVYLSFLTIGDRRIAAAVHFDDGETHYYYNAGVDPDARDLSPGVVMVAKLVERALAEGRRRLDFLRGDEAYKYEWGAVDEPIQRLLVRRTSG